MKILSKIAVLAVVALTFSASAIPIALTVSDSYYLGYVLPGTPPNPASMVTYINAVIALSPGASGTFSGNTTYRSSNVFSPLDAATITGDNDYGTAPTSIDLGSGGYMYLTAHYGNNGDQIWYVAGLTGIVTVQLDYSGLSGNGGGLSGVLAFNPTTTRVPDGGSTVLLLGAALSGLGVMARRFKK